MKKYDKRTRSWRQHTTYSIWYNIVKRCTDPNHHSYESYGGRGIQVQDSWTPLPPNRPASLAFRNFMYDVGLRPSQALSLDRIDPDKGYQKDNVRWATQTVQGRNKRETVMIQDPDPPHQMIPVAELAERLGLRYQTLRYRLKQANLWPGDVHENDLIDSNSSEEEEEDKHHA